ncbi:MAG: cytochrome c biogenesis protein ResB [Thermodesulfobacteriota bacterium]|nr:MAG: cytochrome c biogenesis protein ResB [Thermodesulfobacteriota bacterium]
MAEKAKEAAEGMDARWYRALGSGIWAFLNSLKLTIFILIALAVTSIFGTAIEQNAQAEKYIAEFGETWGNLIIYTNLDNMYYSWWFRGLIVFLAVNIVVCTLERFPPKWRSLLDHKQERFDPKLIEKFAHHETLSIGASPEAVRDRLLQVLRKKRFGTVSSGGGDEFFIYAWKGRIGRLGSDMTHISLLLILLGALLGSVYGYRDSIFMNVGNTVKFSNEPFMLRLDKFWIDYYDSGHIRQYNSVLTIIEDGKEVMQKQIWVNEPLDYKGLKFYQSNYGLSWNKLEEAQLTFRRKAEEGSGISFPAKWNDLTDVPNSKYSVKLVGYTADFAYDEENNFVYSKSENPNNPAIKIEVYEGEKLISSPWLFMNYPGIFPAIPDSDHDFVYTGHKGAWFSGLQYSKDPGTNVVWIGSAVMGIGFIMAFFIYHRRVWIHIKGSGQSTEMKIGGTINKNTFAFERDIREITGAVSSK